MGPCTVYHIVQDTCQAIWDSLVEKEMPPPSQQRWKQIESEFADRWNFPNCLGALDGKHIVITAPYNSGILFHNYKGTFSINLMVLADANYKFIFVDIGQYGSNADGGFSKGQNLDRGF